MPLLPNNRLTLFVTRQNLTVFSKIGVGGINISFSQPKNAIVEQLKKAIPVDIKNKKPTEVEVLFSLDMSFIYSSKKSAVEMFNQADQILPYSADDAEFFVVKNDSTNTIFASPSPIKSLLSEAFGDRVQVHKFTPLLLMYSPKLLVKLQPKSHTVLTCLSQGGSITTILTDDNSVLDFQTYKNIEIQKLVQNLLQVYKSDPDFLLPIDTIITDQEIPSPPTEQIKITKIVSPSKSLDQLLLSNFDSLKYPQVLSVVEIKKNDSNNEQTSSQQATAGQEILQHKKTSSKILVISSVLLILLVVLGVVIYFQFQSTKSGNVRKNGTVAPAGKSDQTIIPSQKFSQPKISPQSEFTPATPSAQNQ